MAISTLIYNAYRDYSCKRSALLLDPIFHGQGIPKGKREAILLIPGFTAGDWTFKTMSRWLQEIGYRTHLSGINFNFGCPQRKVERMLGRQKSAERLNHARGRASAASGARPQSFNSDSLQTVNATSAKTSKPL